MDQIEIRGACEHNLKDIDLAIERGKITVVTGVSGSGKSSLAFDTVLAEAQRRFFYTLSHYSRQFLDLGSRPIVRKITGLSPAIALAQNETQPSRRATVGTLTDTSELLCVMFARFGDASCPKHGLPTIAQSVTSIVDRILATYDGETVAICVPVAEAKKGIFKAQLTAFAEKGYLRAFIDGELVSLSSIPQLAREEKHTIKLIIDHVKVKESGRERLARSIETALRENQENGVAEFYVASKIGALDLGRGGSFSTSGGCPTCGFSWPKLDARYFSANSLGRCKVCSGLGVQSAAETDWDGETEDDPDHGDTDIENLEPCAACLGTGVDREYSAIKLAGRPIQELLTLPLEALDLFLAQLTATELKTNPAYMRVAGELTGALRRMIDVGLGYITLSRRVRTLSGGEAQRLKLAGILTDSLRGVLYVLDEPSQGLHPAEIERLWDSLVKLREQGSTILIVDHDEALMRKADSIVDLGPGGGAAGGRLMARFTPQNAGRFAKDSRTAFHLSQPKVAAVLTGGDRLGRKQEFIEIKQPTLHNLRLPRVRFLRGGFNVVTGVSGAGKSSLVVGTLFRSLKSIVSSKNRRGEIVRANTLFHCAAMSGHGEITAVDLIDRKPVAKSSVSIPASYLDVFGELRDLYAQLPEAQIAGLTARSFSLNAEGGRCEECKGRGETSLSMRFLADARVRCAVCEGKRYRPSVLDVTYLGLNLSEVLNLTMDEAVRHFATHRKIVQRLQPALDLGLGYLKLGQPSASLSGGEAQRLKIVPYLQKRIGAGTLLVLDEPTTGLHFEDVERLVKVLRHIVDLGATVIFIEHNLDIALAADWLVDLGPGAAAAGGLLVYEGEPLGVTKVSVSVTGKYLGEML